MPGLEEYIQQAKAAPVVGDPSIVENGGVSLADVTDPIVTQAGDVYIPAPQAPATGQEPVAPSGASVAATPDTDASVASPVASEPTTPPQLDPAMVALQQQLTVERQAREQAEEANRQRDAEASRQREMQEIARIRAIPDEGERKQAFQDYQLARAGQIIQAQAQHIESTQRATQEREQDTAKNMVIAIRSQAEGIPQELVPLLKSAKTADELEAHIASIKSVMALNKTNQQAANRQDVIDSGVYAAGGTSAGYVPPKAPDERSGDIAGLIASRPIQLITTGR